MTVTLLSSVINTAWFMCFIFFFFSSRRRHTRFDCDWSSDVCSSDLPHDRLITVIERDPAIVRVAGDWFGLERAGPLEILCADATVAVRGLARERRRFDFVIDRKSTRLNSSHSQISYAVFCLKKKKKRNKNN